MFKVGKDLSGPFKTVLGFTKSDLLPCDLFNFIMKTGLQKTGIDQNCTMFCKSVQLLVYAEDINITRDVTAAFDSIECESDEMGPVVSKAKIKCMLLISRDQITADHYTFDAINEFFHHSFDVTSDCMMTV